MTRLPITYLITDGSLTSENFSTHSGITLERIRQGADAGVTHVQIREKSLPARLVFDLARAAVAVTRATETKVLVNDRADIAKAAGANGVHLTGGSLGPSIIKECFGKGFLVAVSTHSVAEVVKAKEHHADFAVFGPVFESPGKGAPVGIEGLNTAVAAADGFPVVALGGIDEKNARDVLSIAAGIAAIRYFNDADKLRELLGTLPK